jgi:Domain of unknown function (DUF4410)
MFFLSLQPAKIRFAARILITLLFLLVVALQPAGAGPQSADASTSIPVLISDFELYSIPPKPNPPASPAPAPNQQKSKTPPVSEDVEEPSVQARRLMDFFAATLVEILHNNGHNVRRTRGQLPPMGALLRGVFTELDEKNRVRRTLLGGTSANPRFFLYVGIFNLARPDKPLYELGPEQPGGTQFGPVIILSNYIPLAKYELDKNPSEEDVRKICAQIAASLTALLSANSNAFSQ